jgi:hypothetical protein
LSAAGLGYFIAENSEKKEGVLDSLGRVVVPFDKYSIASLGEGIFSLNKLLNQNSNKSAYFLFDSKSGKTLNSVPYDEVGKFSEGLVWVKLTGKLGYVNTFGKLVVPTVFESIESISVPSEFKDWYYVEKDLHGDIMGGDGHDDIYSD